MTASEHFRSGRLMDAVAAAAQEVRDKPGDAGRRAFLAELLAFTGDFERADKQLDAAGTLDPKAVPGIALLRQLLRAEMARAQFFAEGRLPELLAQPSEEVRLRLQASIAIREGKTGEATDLLEKAESMRSPVRGTSGGEPFEDLRDLDDLTASVFEVLTSTGKYYWIPMDQVDLLEFHTPEGPQDILWRRCHMIVRGGPDGEVYLPVLYPGTHRSEDDRLRLGRATDWRGGDGSPVRGVGQRMYLVGEKDLSILELVKIEGSSR